MYVVNERYRLASIGPGGWRNCNLGTQLKRIRRKAGVTWPGTTHTLRKSRETELAAVHPLHVVTAWLGNTPKIALKHYLQPTDADFRNAAGMTTGLEVKRTA